MIYFDAAATSFQKPREVFEAVDKAMHTLSSPGRGGYASAMQAAETAFDCRVELAEMYHLDNPEQVVFTQNATHALNLAIKSLVGAGDQVVISGYEHNAVTRPLAAQGAKIRVAAIPLFCPEKTAEIFLQKITTATRAVIWNHVSNVYGFVQPIETVAKLCAEHGIPLIVDASQSAGILDLDMERLGAAFVAFPGHKALYGPQGTGVLLCGNGIQPKTLLEGGTGSESVRQEMPFYLPDRLEAGTHNMPGIAGLLAGVRYVRKRGVQSICRYERELAQQAIEGLSTIPGIRTFCAQTVGTQVGVVSLLCEKIAAEELASRLGEEGIAVRAGLHCAPLAHHTAGTIKKGTVRVSFSDFNTENEVFCLIRTMRRILR